MVYGVCTWYGITIFLVKITGHFVGVHNGVWSYGDMSIHRGEARFGNELYDTRYDMSLATVCQYCKQTV